MKTSLKICLTAIIMICLAAILVSGCQHESTKAVLPDMSLEEMTAQSEMVVVGEVIEKKLSRLIPLMIMTL
ncbi:MAG: hypothetical protein ACOX05_00310 [Bacillota bacterium]|jgi:uncharacterized lipoprotein YbaY